MKRRLILAVMSVLTLSLLGCEPVTPTNEYSHISEDQKEEALNEAKEWQDNRHEVATSPAVEYIHKDSLKVTPKEPTKRPVKEEKPKVEDIAILEDLVMPEQIKEGRSFNISGKISAKVGVLKNITGKFIDETGKTVMEKTLKKYNKQSFEIKKSDIDLALKFGDLTPGKYFVVFSASGENFDEMDLIKQEFEVIKK